MAVKDGGTATSRSGDGIHLIGRFFIKPTSYLGLPDGRFCKYSTTSWYPDGGPSDLKPSRVGAGGGLAARPRRFRWRAFDVETDFQEA